MEQADSLNVSTQTLTDYDECETYLHQIHKHKNSMSVYTNRLNSFAEYIQRPYYPRPSELALAEFYFNEIQDQNQFIRVMKMTEGEYGAVLSTVIRSNNRVISLYLSATDCERLLKLANVISFHLGIIPLDYQVKDMRLRIEELRFSKCYGCDHNKPSQDEHTDGCLADMDTAITSYLPDLLLSTSYDLEETHKLIAQLNDRASNFYIYYIVIRLYLTYETDVYLFV